jgi:hypothetical protein
MGVEFLSPPPQLVEEIAVWMRAAVAEIDRPEA